MVFFLGKALLGYLNILVEQSSRKSLWTVHDHPCLYIKKDFLNTVSPECFISLPFPWIWQNTVVTQLQVERHHSMWWFRVKSRGRGRFALIWDSCRAASRKIVLTLFFRPKLSPEVELDEFKSNRWFNFWHNLFTSVWTKCESKMLVTSPHTFMQKIKYLGITTSWHMCRNLPEDATQYSCLPAINGSAKRLLLFDKSHHEEILGVLADTDVGMENCLLWLKRTTLSTQHDPQQWPQN